MQICQKCAKPTDDAACACDHPDAAGEDVIRGELRDIDARLPPPERPDSPCDAVDLPPVPELASDTVDLPPAPDTPSVAVDPPRLPEMASVDVDRMLLMASESMRPSAPPPPFDTAQGSSERSRETPPPATAASASRNGRVALIAVVFLVGGVGLVMSRPTTRSDSPTPNASANPVAHNPSINQVRPVDALPANPRPAIEVDASSAPKWVRTPQAWASDGSRIVGVELAGENDVRAWMKHVRPVLAVRCLARHVEVFVITDAATSIESVPDQHTVHVSFDGQEEGEQRWADSESKRELFAPDAAVFADQLSRARTMRFGFTPYGAQPVVVDFDVHGSERALESVTKACSDAPRVKTAARTASR